MEQKTLLLVPLLALSSLTYSSEFYDIELPPFLLMDRELGDPVEFKEDAKKTVPNTDEKEETPLEEADTEEEDSAPEEILIDNKKEIALPSNDYSIFQFGNIVFGAGVSLGSRFIAIGDGSKSLLGNQKQTASVTPLGTVSRLTHYTPTITVNTYATYPLTKSITLKLDGDIYLSESSQAVIYDGQSTTAAVELKTSTHQFSGADTDEIFVNQVATAGISAITAGKRECSVTHQIAYGVNLKYLFGLGSKFSAGVGVLKTSDAYQYTADEPPSGGVDTGVYNPDNSTFTESFNIGVVTEDLITTETAYPPVTNPSDAVTRNYTPLAGTPAKYEEDLYWYGIVGDTKSIFNDKILTYGGFGYYWQQLPISPNQTVSAPMVVKATDAILFLGYFGISYKTNIT